MRFLVLGGFVAACTVAAPATTIIDGHDELVATVAEPPGPHCAAGGTAIEVGIDANDDGVLDASEIASTSYVCAPPPPAAPLATVVPEPAGANCANGGSAIETGSDANGDGALEVGEITAVSYVCAPPPTVQELVTVVALPAGALCPNGGQAIERGLDLDGNGVLAAGEITSTQDVCDQVGATTLVSIVAEPAGGHCVVGGKAIRVGVDANADGVLDASEIQNTTYVCAPAPHTIDGDVVLHDQADVDALAGVQQINGQLSVDSASLGAVSLPDLLSVTGLRCDVGLPCPLTSLSLQNLVTAGDIELAAAHLTTLDLPKLSNGRLTLDTAIPTVALPALASGFVTIRGSTTTSVDVPALISGDLWCSQSTALTTLSAPAFATGQLLVQYCPALATVSLPAFTNGDVDISYAGALATVSLPVLANGEVAIGYAGPPSLVLPVLAAGGFNAYDASIRSVSLPMFAKGTVSAVDDAQLETLSAPALTSATTIDVARSPKLSTCGLLAQWAALGYPGWSFDTTCP